MSRDSALHARPDRLRRLTIATALAVSLAAASWADDPEDAAPGRIEFVAKTPLLDAHGTFRRWSFTRIEIDPSHPGESFVDVEVDVASVDTGNGRRDDHLRRDDFFDVAHFPTATVRVRDATPDGESDAGHPRYRATFVLTIRGIEKAVPGDFEILGLTPPTVRGHLVVDRLDFGIYEPPSRWNPFSIDRAIPLTFEAVVPVDPRTGASRLGS